MVATATPLAAAAASQLFIFARCTIAAWGVRVCAHGDLLVRACGVCGVERRVASGEFPHMRIKVGAATAAVAGAAALAWYVSQHQEEEEDDDDENNLQPGMLLLEHAQEHKVLLPIAFLVHGTVNAAEASESGTEPATFALLAEHLEVLLLSASDLNAAAAEPPLTEIASALELALERLRADDQEKLAKMPTFPELGARLERACSQLQIEPGLDTTIFTRATSAAAMVAATSVRTAVDKQRRTPNVDEQQARLLEERNSMLRRQVEEMQVLLAASNGNGAGTPAAASMRPSEYLERFPVPPDEAERRVSNLSAMASIPSPCAELDAAVRGLAEAGTLGPSLTALMVTFMEADTERLISTYCRRPDSGQFVSATPDCGWPKVPRKLTRCQYVVASGKVECIANDAVPRKQLNALLPTLAAADPAVAESLAPGGWLDLIQQHVASAQASAVADSSSGREEALALMLSSHRPTNLYTGAPIRLGVDGRVVGALCAWFTPENDVVAAELETKLAGEIAVLKEQADAMSKLVSSLVSR